MKKKVYTRVMAAILGAALMGVPAFSAGTVMPVYAATSGTNAMRTSSNGGRFTSGTIDKTAKGSISIYKYASNDGWMAEGTGTADDLSSLDAAVSARPISGIGFKALKIADIESVVGGGTAGTYFTNVNKAFTDLLLNYGITLKTKSVGGRTVAAKQNIEDALDELKAKGADSSGNKELPGETAAANAVDGDAHAVDFGYTDENGKAVKNDLELGLYLVAETDVRPDTYLADEEDRGAENVKNDLSQNHENIMVRTSPYLVSVPMTNVTDLKVSGETGTVTTVKAGTAWQYDILTIPKNQTAAVTNKIVDPDTKDDGALEDYEDYSIGDVIHQMIIGDAPVMQSLHGTKEGRADTEAKKYTTYALSYEMQEGLDFDGVTGTSYGKKVGISQTNPGKKDDFSGMTPLEAGRDYKVIAAPVAQDKLADEPELAGKSGIKSFAVQLTDEGLAKLNALKSDSQVVVYFDLVLTPSAKIGVDDKNTGKARLTFKHSTDHTYSYKSNEIRVFTYELDARKIAAAGKQTFDPSNTSFIVRQTKHEGDGYATKDGSENTSKNIAVGDTAISTGTDKYRNCVKFIKETDGVYHVYSEKNDPQQEALTEMSPAKDGTFIIKGLDAAKYTITEIKTQDRYMLLKSEFDVDLKAASEKNTGTYRGADILLRQAVNGLLESHVNGKLESATVITDGSEADLLLNEKNKGIAYLTIENAETVTLRTGGNGTLMIYIAAAGIGAAVIAAYAVRNKKNGRAA